MNKQLRAHSYYLTSSEKWEFFQHLSVIEINIVLLRALVVEMIKDAHRGCEMYKEVQVRTLIGMIYFSQFFKMDYHTH